MASASYSSGDEGYLYISSGDAIEWDSTNSGDGDMFSNMKLRDTSAWYHLVWSVDTTQSTAGNRMKFYLNGTQMTSWSTETQPNEDQQLYWNVGGTYYPYIGRRHGGDYFDGYIGEVAQVDNAQLAATSFGEFDEDSPTIWKPKDLSDLTFGTSGYWLDMEDSSDFGNDVSGVGNDFAGTNLAAADQCVDSPTNNFATANPLQKYADTTFQEGNTWTRQLSNANALIYGVSTIGVAKGKWYMEFKHVTNDNDSLYGITTNPTSDHTENNYPGQQAHSFGFLTSDGNSVTGASGSSYGSAASSNDIIGVALDITNENLYFAVNNTWQDSGDPTSGATGTGAIDISGIGAGQGFYFFAAGSDDTSNYDNPYWYFGNPAFSISSAANDANGYGTFEYAPPSGFLSLCTKNLGSDG